MTNLSTLRNAIQQFDTNLFTPYAVGFDRTFDRLFDYATHQATSTGFPPYNIIRTKQYDDDKLTFVELAIAGYSKDDIDVTVEDGVLIIEGKSSKSPLSEKKEVHKGIASRKFKRSFSLGEYIEVRSADLKDGLLTITLEEVIPEEKKPKVIEIN